MAPKSDPTDGKFSLCVVNELGKFATFPVIMKFMKGTQEGDPIVRMVNSRTIKVTALDGTIPAMRTEKQYAMKDPKLRSI